MFTTPIKEGGGLKKLITTLEPRISFSRST